MPNFYVPDGNDVGVVYINAMENQKFPPFVSYVNSTQTIVMNPVGPYYNGRTYYFSVVLKNKHSDYIMNVYYMTIRMSGQPYNAAAARAAMPKVNMSVPYLNYHSEGVLEFSLPVKMDTVVNNFDSLFSVYVNNTL